MNENELEGILNTSSRIINHTKMNSNYFDFSSSFRDRSLFPSVGAFEVPISIGGRKGNIEATDPVCLSTPIKTWSSNYFNALGGNILNGTLIIQSIGGYSSDVNILIFKANSPGSIQLEENYYCGAVLFNTTTNTSRRIKSCMYIGNDQLKIYLFYPFNDDISNGDILSITDPSDFTDLSFPVLFIPQSENIDNLYNNNYIYNESINDYRKIIDFDTNLNTIMVETKPIIGWSTSHNYNIRQELPDLVSTTTAASTTRMIVLPGSINYGNITPGDFIRIRGSIYGNGLLPPGNETRRIISYNSATLTATVFPPFTTVPSPTATIEVLAFTFDNLNPFSFIGSQELSQQSLYYNIELKSITLPLTVLQDPIGGTILNYPYIYVELLNITSAGAGNKNLIYSNNTWNQMSVFKVSIDINNSVNPKFIKLVGDNNPQTMFFKPNETLFICIKLPNGKVFHPKEPEFFSPSLPNHNIQISLLFSFQKNNNEIEKKIIFQQT